MRASKYMVCSATSIASHATTRSVLLEEGSLLEELQGCEDWETMRMQEVVESWLEGHWEDKGQQLVAERAEALASQVGSGWVMPLS